MASNYYSVSKLLHERDKEKWIWRGIEPCLPSSPSFVTSISAEQSDVEFSKSDVEFNSEIVASFNWVMPLFGSPFMMIPGCPDRYKEWTGNLEVNTELWYWYQDGFVNPKYPLESLFRAVNVCNSVLNRTDFNWQEIDVCTDRDVLQRLFAISNGNGKKINGPIRIDIERVGNIVTLTRLEEKYSDCQKDYRQAFIKASTERLPGVPFSNRPGDGSFRCVKRVKFGGLTMMVRLPVEAADFSNVVDLVTETIGYSMGNFKPPEPFDSDSVLASSNSPKHLPAKKRRLPENTCLPVEHASTLIKFNTKRNIVEKWAVMFFGGVETLVCAERVGELVTETSRYSLETIETRFLTDGRPVDKLVNLAKLLNVLVDLARKEPEDQLLVAIWDPMESTLEPDELLIGRRQPSAFIRAAPPKLLQELKMKLT